MIQGFTCHNFRNIDVDNIKFEKINLLIGPNNSGKTNFIKALMFCSDMVNNPNDKAFKSSFINSISRNGWDHARNNNVSSSNPIEFSWKLKMQDEILYYKLSCLVDKKIENCNIVLECLDSDGIKGKEKNYNYFCCHEKKLGYGIFSTAMKKGKQNHRLPFNLDCQEILFNQFKDVLLKNKEIYDNNYVRVDIAEKLYSVKEFFEGFRSYATSRFNTTKLKEPVDNKSLDVVLSNDAVNFANVFARYKSENLSYADEYVKHMQELLPYVSFIDVVNAYDKLIFKIKNEQHEYDLSDLSEGTLKALILNMIINFCPLKQNTVLAIDEPEMNLHPAWQKRVGLWIQESNAFQQCFISTHSPDFLDSFTEEFRNGNVAVFVFNDKGNHSVKRINYDTIRDELGDWELGDLYRVNDPALGGWPW